MNDKGHERSLDDIIKMLSQKLGEPVMKSSQRLLIIITIWYSGRMRFHELQRTLNMGKGSLSNHLETLSRNGLIKTRDIITLSGPGKMVELTDAGKDAVKEYIDLMKILFNGK